MRVKPKSNDYYKKYRYLIWRDDIGFLHLETFSSEELLKFSKNINDQVKLRTNIKDQLPEEDQLLEDANIKILD